VNLDDVLSRGEDADDVLRALVSALVAEAGCAWAAILFAEGDELVLGPHAGEPDPGLRLQVPVAYEGTRVAELIVDGCDDRDFLAGVAARIGSYCLVGWDTAGEPWNP
jgi:hypothetical protein